MKSWLSLFILLSVNLIASDTLKVNKYRAIAYSSLFVAGASEGLREVLTHHYYLFERRFSGANQQYWNPAVSWTNKGSNLLTRTILVGSTDAYHLCNTIRNTFVLTAIFTIGKPINFKQVLIKTIACTASYNLGKHLLWSGYFRP